MNDHTSQPKPSWIPEGEYPEYSHIVKSWGYEIIDTRVFGCYQGDIGYLLKDGDRHGLAVIGYGSCSGCDALAACTPYADDADDADWTDFIALAEGLERGIHWEDTHEELMEWVNNTPENHWWYYDDDMVDWLNSHGANLTPINFD